MCYTSSCFQQKGGTIKFLLEIDESQSKIEIQDCDFFFFLSGQLQSLWFKKPAPPKVMLWCISLVSLE